MHGWSSVKKSGGDVKGRRQRGTTQTHAPGNGCEAQKILFKSPATVKKHVRSPPPPSASCQLPPKEEEEEEDGEEEEEGALNGVGASLPITLPLADLTPRKDWELTEEEKALFDAHKPRHFAEASCILPEDDF